MFVREFNQLTHVADGFIRLATFICTAIILAESVFSAFPKTAQEAPHIRPVPWGTSQRAVQWRETAESPWKRTKSSSHALRDAMDVPGCRIRAR